MPPIAPFRGIRYDSRKTGPLQNLVGPCYDVVTPEEQKLFHDLHDCNFLHLLYPNPKTAKPHEHAAGLFQAWRGQGFLVRDPEPAIYLYEIDFLPEGREQRISRTGFFSLLELSDYQDGKVRPHERTFTAVKKERLESVSSSQANFSGIFVFYDDPLLGVINILRAAAPAQPDMELTDLEGINHRLWLVTDPEALREAARFLAERPFYIADGHHRYETGLAYRDVMREAEPDAPPLAAFNYTLAYAAAMQDPGLAIRPAHRLIRQWPEFELEGFLARAAKYFKVQKLDLKPDQEADRSQVRRLLSGYMDNGNALGFVCSDSDCLYLMVAKKDAAQALDMDPNLRALDVVVLTELLLGKALGLDQARRDDENLLIVDSNLDSAITRVTTGKARLGFLLNPTKVPQVKAVADAGLVMPRKSTLFYPKVATGLVVNPVKPGELVADPLAYALSTASG